MRSDKQKARVRTLEGYFNATFKLSVGALLHLMAVYSRIFLWRNNDLVSEYGLYGEVKGLYPIAWADVKFSDNTETYLYIGTDICIVRFNREGKYSFVTSEGPKTLSEFIDEYPEKTVEPFLFNINLFK
jgi:hypothetical protein